MYTVNVTPRFSVAPTSWCSISARVPLRRVDIGSCRAPWCPWSAFSRRMDRWVSLWGFKWLLWFL